MSQKHSILHLNIKVGRVIYPAHGLGAEGKALVLDETNGKKLEDYVNNLEYGQQVDIFYDANKDDGTLAQLAKIHACIRQLAIDNGDSFEDLKFEIKRTSGLCVTKEINGVNYMICKSLSKCSKEELNLVIDRIIKVGEIAGINFH